MDTVFAWLSAGNHWSWLFQLFALLLVVTIVNIFESRFYWRTVERLKGSEKLWDDAMLIAMHHPAKLLIWGGGLTLILQSMPIVSELFSKQIGMLRLYLIIGACVWFLYRLIHELEKNLSSYEPEKKSFDANSARVIGRALRAVLLVSTVLVMLNTMGINLSGILTFGGVGTLVVGLAGKEMLSNFFGGFVIIWDKPFQEGEWIRLPDKNLEGVVEEIGWRMTKMRTFDRRPMFVPNATFTSVAIENPSRMYNRRIKETIGIRYDDADKMSDILQDIRVMLKEHPDIDHHQFLMVHFLHFNSSSLDISVYCFTKTTRWELYRAVQEDVLLRINAIIKAHGAEIAFPTQTVHVPDPIHLEQANFLNQ